MTASKTFPRLLCVPLFGLLAATGQADPLPSGTGVYLSTSSFSNGVFSYASGPGISTYNAGGFETEQMGANSEVVIPGPSGFPLGLTTASLEQSSTSTYGTSYAKAVASLEQGTLRARANSNDGSQTTCGTPTCITSQAAMLADAWMKDVVTFHLAGTSSATVQVNVHVDGTVNAGPYTAATSALTYILNLGGGGFQYGALSNYTGANGVPSIVLSGFTGGIVEQPTFTNATNTGFDFSGNLTVTDGLTLPLFIALQLDSRGGMDADFGNTAKFSFGLPANVSFTSASGVLLTAAVVPEPGTWALMLCGLAAVGSLVRSRGGAAQT